MKNMTLETALDVLIDTLLNESGGGGVKSSSTLERLASLKPEIYDALSVLLHELGYCGGERN